VKDLQLLAGLEGDNYKRWPLGQKKRDALIGATPKKPREIQQPKTLLAAVQKRIAMLLGRIEKPEFVYSATKGRCYVANAKQHCNRERATKVDIKNFYPSVKRRKVRNFFASQMECAEDVANVLAVLCTLEGTMPTGSPVSPVLSYFSCSELFDRIAALASDHELVFTLYVDDMVFSGPRATKSFTELVVRELKKEGFIGHKIVHFRAGDVKVITGVAVWSDRISVPFKRQQRIRAFQTAFDTTSNPDHVRVLGATLLGQYREAERLDPGSRLRAIPVKEKLDSLAPVDIEPKKGKRRNVKLHQLKSSFADLRMSLAAKVNLTEPDASDSMKAA